jgi:hypothetical protein
MSRFPHFLDSRLADDEVVSLTFRPLITLRKIPGTHLCQRLSPFQGHAATGRIRSTEKSNDIGNRNHDLLACSTVSQPTTLPSTINTGGRLLKLIITENKTFRYSCVIAFVVKCWLLLQRLVTSFWICGGQSGYGVGFCVVFTY